MSRSRQGHHSSYFRELDTRIARWWSTDPVTHPHMSPYNIFDGNPVYYIDPSGADSDPTDPPSEDKKAEMKKKGKIWDDDGEIWVNTEAAVSEAEADKSELGKVKSTIWKYNKNLYKALRRGGENEPTFETALKWAKGDENVRRKIKGVVGEVIAAERIGQSEPYQTGGRGLKFHPNLGRSGNQPDLQFYMQTMYYTTEFGVRVYVGHEFNFYGPDGEISEDYNLTLDAPRWAYGLKKRSKFYKFLIDVKSWNKGSAYSPFMWVALWNAIHKQGAWALSQGATPIIYMDQETWKQFYNTNEWQATSIVRTFKTLYGGYFWLSGAEPRSRNGTSIGFEREVVNFMRGLEFKLQQALR